MADFFDSGSGVPGFSWEGMPKGTRVEGILAQSHETTQQTDIDNNPKFYESGDPMMQAVMTLQTEYRNFEWTSEKYQEKAKADEIEDDGLRRLFVRGSLKQPSLNKGLRDALRAAKVKAPEVGATIGVTFVKKTPIAGSQYKANDFAVDYTSPTPASLAKIANHQTAAVEPDEDDAPPF